MGNAPCVPERELVAAPRPQLTPEERFQIAYIEHAVDEGVVFYEFMVHPPQHANAPGNVIRKNFEVFQELDIVMQQKYRSGWEGELPVATFFECTTPEFIEARAAALTVYLQTALELEPLPRTRAWREFLGIWQPLPVAPTVIGHGNPVFAGVWRLPVGVVSGILAFHEPIWVLQTCSAICHAMREATRNPRCWPSLRFRTARAERWIDPLFTILSRAGRSLQSLTLDISFENTQLGMAIPAGLTLSQLRRLSLSIWDEEMLSMAGELLECIESPSLQKIAIEGSMMSQNLFHGLCRVILLTSGNLVALKLLWLPHQNQIRVDEETALALGPILAAIPRVEQLVLGVPDQLHGRGVARSLAALQPPHVAIPSTQPLLADSVALVFLQQLTFDFLSDDALVCFNTLEDRSFHLQRARFSGSKQLLNEPNEALISLLAKLGDDLEEFSLLVEIEADMRPFFTGFMRSRIGALPEQWRGRSSLRKLELNWTAFDDQGVQCITENCPQLHTLCLSRSEYWTDAAVGNVAQNLPLIQHFRLRSSAMLSDMALHTLGEVAHKFVTLELEPSYSMSGYAIDQLRQKLDPNCDLTGTGLLDFLDPSAGAVRMIHAAAGEPNPFDGPNPHDPINPRVRRSSALSLKLLKPEEEEEEEEPLGWPAHMMRNRSLDIGW